MSWLDWLRPRRNVGPAPEVQEAMNKRDRLIRDSGKAVKEVDRLNLLMDEYERAEIRRGRRRR